MLSDYTENIPTRFLLHNYYRMKLYEIAQKIESFIEMVSQDHEEAKEGEAVKDWTTEFWELEMDFAEKMENTVKYIKNIEAENSVIDEEIKRLQARKKKNKNKIESMKHYVDYCMNVSWKTKESFWTFTVSYRKSSSVELLDESLIPEKYKTVITETKINKSDIKSDWKLWEVPWTTIVEKQNLQIK